MTIRGRDAEAQLNLPPGFRFHPTDEELVVHYLCRKITYQTLPVPIIAEIDLYRYNPWQLPDMALFGTKEWYFFTPRDRKYPNGSRPNRTAGNGYWKATGADKPIRPAGSAKHLGIKKALVFYSGKAPKGTKTNWIMHEYRLAEPNRRSNTKGSLRLDEWVLCRLYNKKNNWHTTVVNKKELSAEEPVDSFEAVGSESFTTSESDVENDSMHRAEDATKGVVNMEDIGWFIDMKLEDLHNGMTVFGATAAANDMSCQDYSCTSPHLKPYQSNLLPSWGLWSDQ